MAYNEARKKSTLEYRARSIKRISVDVKAEYYDRVKSAADSSGESLSGYVKKALNERMQQEGFLPDQTETESK